MFCKKELSHATFYRDHFDENAVRACSKAKAGGHLNGLTIEQRHKLINNCELACRYRSRNVISTTVQMSEMPDHTKSIEKQCNEFNMGYIIMNEVAAELVRNLNASCFGRSRISDKLINKMIKSGKNETHTRGKPDSC